MTFKLTFKTHDVLDQMDTVFHEHEDDLKEKARKASRQWIKWDEYITVEIDTDKNTCVVLKT